MANAKKLWEKGQTKQKTTPAASSGPAASAVDNIVKNTQSAAAGQQRVSQSAVDQMLADVQKSPYATVSEVIRAGQKPVTAQPVQQNKITAGRESTTPLQKQTGSASIKDRLAKMAQVSRIGKDSTANKPLPTMTAGGALAGITTKVRPAASDTVRKLNSLAADIRSNENDLINMNRRLSALKAKANRGDASAVDSYNQLADRYNQKFESYVANIGIYNTLYQGEYRDSAVRQNYAQREYQEYRRQNRDAGVRQEYRRRQMEEELQAPVEITQRRKGGSVGAHSQRRISGEAPADAGFTYTHTPTRGQQAVRGAVNTYGAGMAATAGIAVRNLFAEDGGRGRSAGETWNTGEGTEVEAAARVWNRAKSGARDWADGLIDTGRDLNERGEIRIDLAKRGLGEVGQAVVDLGVIGVQMAADMGIGLLTGGSMLPALFTRSMGSAYLDKEGEYGQDAAELYGLGIGAVEALSEKMFSVFSIATRFAKGAVTQEMSGRIIDGLVKRMASSPGGRTALNRLFTILFSAGSEGLEEVAAGIMEPLIRKITLDHDVKAWQEIDWESALYEGLLGAVMGGLGGAVDLTNTRPTYWKYYRQGIDENIDRYVAAVRNYGLESREALQAAKEVWDGGTRKMNAVAGFIVDANEDGEGGTYVPIQKATTEDLEKGLPVTYHQLAAAEETTRYGRTDAEGNPVQGPSIADSLYLGKYLQNEEKIRRQEAARREEAARLDAEEKARVDAGKTAQSAPAAGTSSQGGEVEPTAETPQGETVRLDTARSAQTRAQAPQGVTDLSGIPESELTQEEKDELAYGSGAVEDLGRYTGLAQRMGAPVAGRSSARVANVARTGNEDITRRVNELAGRLQSKGLQSVEYVKADPRMNGMRVGNIIFINDRLTGEAAGAAAMGHEVVHFAGDFDAQLINDLIAAMRRQGRDIDGLVETKREIYRKQFAEMGQAWDEEQMNQAYFEEEVAADFIGEICRADSETLDRIAAEEPGLIRRIINALRNMLARITGNQQAVYEQAIDRLNAALEKAGRNENAVRADGGVRYELSDRLDIPEVPAGTIPATADEALNMDITDARNIARYNNEIKSIMDGTMPPRQMLLIGRPPEIIQKYMNGSGNPLYMPQTSVKKTIYPAGVNGGKHGLGEKVMQGLPYQFSEPLAITGNTTQHENYGDNSIVVWTDWLTDAGDPVIIPIRIDVNGYVGVYNNVNTVFNVHNEEYLNDLLRDGNILYTKNNEDIHALLDSLWRQVPQVPTTEDTLYDSSIAEREGNVNSDQATPEADLQATIQQLTDQMTKLTEMLSERTGEAPAVAAETEAAEEIDSGGSVLSKGQQEYFKDSKARDEEGRLLILFRGGNGETVFNGRGEGFAYNRNSIYLTDSKEVARAYSANVQTFYANLTHPLILDAEGRSYTDIPIPEDAPQSLKDYFYDTADADNLPVYAEEHGYDGVIIRNVREGKGGGPMTEVIALRSNQVKNVGNENPTSNPDVRFSLNDTVETKGNLVALHNLNAEKLGKALDLGGFPMPSIAVTKADIPHTNFGKITLVMDRRTVDPKANRKNEVYSADAWTPTFPQTEYEADDKVELRLYRKYLDLEKQYGRELVDELHTYGVNLKYELDRNGGLAGILERERNNKRMKQVYMLDTGIDLPEPTIKETVTRMKEGDIAHNEYFVDALGEDVLREMAPRDGEKVGDARRRWWADHGEEMERVYEEYLRQPEFAFSEEEIANVLNWMTKSEYIRHAVNARNYLLRGPETVTEEPDYTARDEAIAKVDQAAYEEWLENLFAGAEKSSGIYNNKDIFTPSGNRRSFAATHFPVTLENIVKAMATQNDGNSKNSGSFYGVKTLRAGTAVTFRSIPEMHALEDRLQHLTEEEAEQLNKALQDRLLEVMNKIDGRRTYGSAEDNVFIRLDSIGYIMEEIAETGSWPAEKVQRVFGKYSYDLTPEMGQEVSDLLTDIQQMPVNIFEAKPKRVVRFDEVRAAIVPDSTDQALIDRLHEAGVEDVRTYEDGNDASRLAEVNAVPNVRFSFSEEEGTEAEAPKDLESMEPSERAKELIVAAARAKQISKQTERILRKIDLTEKEQGLVNALLSDALTVGELPSGINRRAVIQAYEAKKAARDAAAPVEEYNKQHRELLNEEARDACQNSTDWKNKKFELGMEAETPRRIFYGLTKDEAEAEKLTHKYVDPIRHHHAQKVRMIKEYAKQIEDLHIDKKRRHGNKVSEDYAVQYVGELEFIIDWLEELPQGETRGGVTYDEAKSLLYDFWKENPNLDKDHIRNAVAGFHRIYDEVFAMWNEARVLNGYAPVDYRKGYFPHFTSRSMDTIVQAMTRGMGFGVEVAELPTDIAGLTHMFKPGTQWSGHALQRTGNKTDYSALEGWDRYIETVGNIIYHTEDIQRWRALERALRYKHGTPGVREEMDKIRKNKDLTEAEREAEFDKLLGKDGKPDVTHLSAFVRWVNEYTNFLAGKRHLADRIVESFIGRNWYTRLQQLENTVGFNMLAGNIASVMTNFAPMFQALGGVRSTSMLQAIGSYAIGKVQHDVWTDGSDFLVNRKSYDPLYTNAMGKVKNAMFAPFNWVDDFVSEVVVRAKYIDELRNGASPGEAMRTADVFAGSVIADRTVGELPLIYNSKSLKIFTMFQVEVNNDLRYLLKDMPREARKDAKATVLVLFRSLLRYLLAVYTFNDLFEALFGRRVTFDPLNTLNDLAGVAFGKKLPNGFEVMAEWIRTKEAPDWDTLFDAEHSDKPLSELAAIGEDVAGDLPFVTGLFGGGRYPVFAFLPNRSQTQSGFAAWEDLLFTHENDTKYDWQQIYKMNRNALTYLQPIPFIPGGQVRRTAEGIMAAAKGGSYNLTKKGEILQYPILTTYDIVKSAIFGKNTTKGGKEWVKSDFDSLSVEETAAYIDLVTNGSDGQKIYDVLRDLHGDDRDAVTKAYALASANLKDSERIRLLDALVSESQGEKFAAMMTDGDLTFRQCAEVYEKYHQLSKMGELKDANDDYVYKKAVLATQFSAWLDDEGYSDVQKTAITEQYKFWNMVPAEAGNYEKLTGAGLSTDNAVTLTSDWSELEPLPDEDEVKDFQKIAVVASAGYLSEKEKHYAIRSLLKDEKNKSGVSPQDKYTSYVMDYHIPAEVYSQYCTLSYGVTGDDLDGDGTSDKYTKCDKLFAIIDRLPLSNGQKTALAIYKGGVAESTVYKRAPWLH